MRRKKIIVILVILAALVVVSASLKTYRIREGASGTLFWNADEAYLFMNVGKFGTRLSYLQYIVEGFREALGAVRSPDARRYSVVVLRITPEAVQRYVKENTHLGSFILFEKNIYSRNLDDGTLWRWSGTAFVRASGQEQHSFETGKHPLGPDFNNFDGWSERCCFPRPKVEFEVEGRTLTLATNPKLLRQMSIELTRPGNEPERIWYLETRPSGVSKNEYEKFLGEN